MLQHHHSLQPQVQEHKMARVITSLRTTVSIPNKPFIFVKPRVSKTNGNSFLKLINSKSHGDYRSLSTSSSLKSDMYFSKDHCWITVTGNMGTVGITDHAQHSLGEIVFPFLPKIDSEVKAGEKFGSVEAVKANEVLLSPVSGKVKEKNVAVEDKPEMINKSAENEGWLIKVELTKKEELKDLFNKASYEKYLK